MPASTPPISSPEPLKLLIASVPAKTLLKFIKADPALAHTVFPGFSAREKSLEIPQVRQRIERELEKNAASAQALWELWQTHFQPLLARLDDGDVVISQQTLLLLRKQYGATALEYAVLHANREEVRAMVTCLTEAPCSASSARSSLMPSIAPDTERAKFPTPAVCNLQQRITDLNTRLQLAAQTTAALQKECSILKSQLKDAHHLLGEQTQQLKDAERRLAREQRRGKKAEEDAEALRKAMRSEQQSDVAPTSPSPRYPSVLLSRVYEAIRLLQNGLGETETSTPSPEHSSPTPQLTAAPLPKRTPVRKIPASAVTLPTAHGPENFSSSRVLEALRLNDQPLLERIRNGIAALDHNPPREAAAIAEFTKAGIPAALLTGPLRPALIDGSNIANLPSEKARAQLAFIQQARRAAWSEGYFPVLIIVDASLRYQIDRPDQLMDMVEHGEIMMAPAGTSADELLIDESAHQRALLITNDRMTDWPAAKDLEKRYVELIGGNVCLGGFHRSALWFR
jgi:hypothetical protein